jgi:hypothetical protein
MQTQFDPWTHGLWILGSVFNFLGALLAANMEVVEGATALSLGLAAVISFALILVGGLAWISAAINAREDEMLSRK